MKFGAKILKRKLLEASSGKITHNEEDLVIWTSFKKLVIGLADSLDPHFVTEVLRLVKARDIENLLSLTAEEADPQKYESADSYWCHAVIAAFLDKFPFKDVPNLNPRRKALERSARAELLCRLANKRLSHYRGREFRLPENRRKLNWIFHSARLKISRWLGSVDLNEIADNARHGPGGCLGVKRPKTTRYYKYASESYTMAARCGPYVRALIETTPLWRRSLSGLGPFDEGPAMSAEMLSKRCTVTNYNKVTYVPKTARTDRAIAVEPMLNVYFQLGVGSAIRDRLRKVGLDLDSSWELNKKLAHEGSLLGDSSDSLATVDLSMASDTLAIELVRELLPPDWYDLLFDLRSPNGKFGDEIRAWAKFSSMGNGYTFELETLIFYALSQSVCEYLHLGISKVSVFGDDIIVPTRAAPLLLETLKYCGFVPNESKTFVSGHFRESCGGDYFRGVDVRPFYLKQRLRVKQDLIFLRNNFFLLLRNRGELLLQKVRKDIVAFIDSRLPKVLTDHLLGPITGPIDGTIYTPWDEAHRSALVRWDRDLHEMRFPALCQVARRFRGWSPFIYLQFMEGTGTTAVRSKEALKPPSWGNLYPMASSRSVVTRSMSGVTQLQLHVTFDWQ